MMKAYASGGSGKNGVNGKAANGQSLRRQRNESMGDYYRRTGTTVLGGNRRTRGVPAAIRPAVRGR